MPISDATSPSPSSSNIDTITLDNLPNNAVLDPNAIPEQIGYLHAIGVDYGYGPTSAIQWLLEHAHVSLDLPWWGAIVLTAASLRLLMFPLYMKMSDSQARLAALAPILKPFNDKRLEATRKQNSTAAMLATQQMSAVKKRAGISTSAMLAPVIAQGVLGYCGYRLMSYLATLPVPGLTNGGFLWVTDLTMTDGYLILPLLMASTMHIVLRLGGESGTTSTMTPGMRKTMLYGMPVAIFLFTAWQPGAVALWFMGSGIIGIPQSLLLRQRKVREYFGLAPMYTPKPSEQTGLLGGLLGLNSPTASASASRSTSAKNPASMRPQYQSPKIRTAPDRNVGKTIDARLVKRAR